MKTHIIRIYGIVQGVGFRPFAANTARTYHISGTVSNKGSYVEIMAQGTDKDISAFTDAVRCSPPKRALIADISVTIKDMPPFDGFIIAESAHDDSAAYISPDIAICSRCRAELTDPTDRRYLHPFINCTQCGPRLTILSSMPYDRERTSMASFPMCPKCAGEYTDHMSRRYDAQPVCCTECGPRVYILGEDMTGTDAIAHVRDVIRTGGIAAVKGIGGFHLCCDARSDSAVRRLRELKSRPSKPFAVMCRDMDTIGRECTLDDTAADLSASLLDGWQKPIVLLPKSSHGEVSPYAAPDCPYLGVMLPYSPLHVLLFELPDRSPTGRDFTDCLIMTSGNVPGAPICRTDEDAADIAGYCDIILSHDREILLRADDSVTDIYDGRPYMIRRSRGYSPLPFPTDIASDRCVLAVGGELKGTFAIAKDGMIYPSPYIGDMSDVRSIHALQSGIGRMTDLMGCTPDTVVCDSHPMYNSAELAGEIANSYGVPLIRLQHHYAHILSCMAEHRRTDTVIGVALDGTGYGDDGTIWGGEILVCDVRSYERADHITPYIQAGGDAAAREGWRIAAGILSGLPDAERITEELGICSSDTLKIIRSMISGGVNCVRSTSCGRLFDAVSAILGIRRTSSYEGEAASALMYAAGRYATYPGIRDIPTPDDTLSLVRDIAIRRADGEDADMLAYAFHRGLARIVAGKCLTARERYGIDTVALSGGCFQNTLLLRMVQTALEQEGVKVLTHSLIPPNDGGICVGQAYHAVYR